MKAGKEGRENEEIKEGNRWADGRRDGWREGKRKIR